MKVTYKNPGFRHSLDSILLFQTEGQTPYWSDAVFCFYPQICKEEFIKRDTAGKVQYLTNQLESVCNEILPELEEKPLKYNEHFLKHEKEIRAHIDEAESGA